MAKATVIGNPRAGRGTVSGGWEQLRAELGRGAYEVEAHLTAHAGHAIELAAKARASGSDLVVAVGGDGTVHEVVNGLLTESSGVMPELGIVPLGSGCDYAKSFGIEPGWKAGAVERLTSDVPARLVDAGEVVYQTTQGEQRRYFCNIAEVGIGPEIAARAARLPRFLRGSVYFFGFWLTLPGFERRRATVEVGGSRHEADLTNLVVAICRYFGGGMQIAPDADPTDGLFDVQIHTGTKLDYVKGIPKVYRGTHLPHPKVKQERSAALEVTCEPPGLIEADGEVLGTTPARFRTLPGALKLKV